MRDREDVCKEEQGVGTVPDHCIEGRRELFGGSRVSWSNRQSQGSRRSLRLLHASGHRYIAWNGKDRYTGDLGHSLLEKLQLLADDFRDQRAQPGDISAGASKAGDEARSNWVATRRHDNGDRAGRPFGSASGLLPLRHDDVNLELDQLGGEARQARQAALCPSVLEHDGLLLDMATVVQPSPERVDVDIRR